MERVIGDKYFLRHQIEAIQNATVDAICTVASDGEILSVNDAACIMFGYDKAELLNRKLHKLLPQEFQTEELRHLEKYGTSVPTRFPDSIRNVKGRRKNGEEFPFRLSVKSIEIGEQLYYTCVGHDMSSYKKSRDTIISLHKELKNKNKLLMGTVSQRSSQLEQTIEELAAANSKLAQEIKEREEIAKALQSRETQLERLLHKERELGELKSRFVSMASHEFRTPLTTMLTSVEIIEMAVTDGPKVLYKHTRRIREGIGYLRNVLEDFLHLGKLDVKGTDLLIQEFDVREFVERITEDLNLMCKPGQEIELTLDQNITTTSHSKNGLRICITNLLTNAIKYSDEGSAIEFVVKVVGTDLLIQVKDEGIGIPKSEIVHLFTRFFRASNAETEKGTGLGLHIVARYAKAMGGEINVVSDRKDGSTFTLTLPHKLSSDVVLTNSPQSDPT